MKRPVLTFHCGLSWSYRANLLASRVSQTLKRVEMRSCRFEMRRLKFCRGENVIKLKRVKVTKSC